ncbi:DUF3179 domain-containing protein [Natronomonas sp. EA1]|uniref:DUF3179 domain-containing protein n=1 Tax=Natronomonas sp. EA1 TaxID=3421655 RepID=UPI003EBD50A1
MKRRRYLALAGSGLLAGCSAGYRGSTAVPRDELRRGAPRDGIPAITDPRYAASWDGIEITFTTPEGRTSTYEPQLHPSDLVVGVDYEGATRAYPLKVLAWHEVVNAPDGLLVSYCPLCRSGVVAKRVVDGSLATFGVSGLLYRENLVMYDSVSDSLWSQLLGKAIRGPATGTELSLVPASLTDWGTWREQHPDAEVLLPPPLSDTVVGEVRLNYGFDLYGQLSRVDDYLGDESYSDTRLPRKALVLGVAHGGEATAYAFLDMQYQPVVNDTVGGLPVVVVNTETGLFAYERGPRRFELRDGLLSSGGATWTPTTGAPVDADDPLSPVAGATSLYWFAWLAHYPNTEVWSRG